MTDNIQPRTIRSSWLPLVILAVTLAVVFYRLLLGEVFFWGLPALQFVPWRQFAFDMLYAGYLPLWNPYNGAGAPLFANYQSALLYPFSWPGYVLPLAWQMSITAVLHLFLAGWGMWRFTGRLGVPDLGRGLSALAFGLTGYLVARLGTYPTISAAGWLPWLLWAALGVLTQNRRRDLAWLALFAGLQLLAGHAQTTWYSLLLVGAFVLWWATFGKAAVHLPHPNPSPFDGEGLSDSSSLPCDGIERKTEGEVKERAYKLMLIAGALLLGAGIAALQLLATGELLLQSQRSGGVDYDFAMNFSYAPTRLLNLLSPNVFGTPADGSYITKGAFFEDAVYIGLIPLVSALAAVIAWLWWKLRRVERPTYFATVSFWIIVVVIGFVFALGEHSPIFPFLYNHVPTFDLFQAPVRWHLWTVFGLSVLAGIGAGAWGRGKWLLFGTRLLTAACLGAVMLALLAPRFLPPDVADNDGVNVIVQAVIFTGIVGALAGDLTLIQPEAGTRRYRWWSLAVLIVVAVDLGLAARGLNPTVPAAFFDRRETSSSNMGLAYWSEESQETVMYERFLPFDDYRVAVEQWQDFRTSQLPNLNLLDRQSLLNNFDPLLVGHFADYLDLIEADPAQADQLLMAALSNDVFKANGARDGMNGALRGWAIFVDSICWHTDNESLKSGLLNPAWLASSQVHLMGDDLCPKPESLPSSSPLIGWKSTPDSVVFEIPDGTGGLLYVPQTDYPGWQAWIDGQPTFIMRANLAFMAVGVPTGTDEVRLEYHPWWLLPGAFISFLSLLILLVLFRSNNPGREG